jgi:hypothetical protein
MTALQSKVSALLRADFVEEASRGFPRLRRIPCTGIVRLLDYFASLGPAEQQSLLDGIAYFGTGGLIPSEAPRGNERISQMSEHPGFGPYYTTMRSPGPFAGGYRYTGVKTISQMANCAEIGGLEGWLKGFSGLALEPRRDLLPDIGCLKPAQAPVLRKQVGAVLKQRGFVAEKKTPRGGDNKYTTARGNSRLTVSLDFGSYMGQLCYGVSVANDLHTLKIARLTYESLWGQHGGWDYLTEENAVRSIELLPELVDYIACLADRVNGLTSGDE